ncbi:hypothetical protein ACE6H2_008259 [Prunus campanulata]
MGLSCGALKLHLDYDPAPIIIPFITLPFCVCLSRPPSLSLSLSLSLFISFLSPSLSLFSLPLQYKPPLSLSTTLYTPLTLSLVLPTIAMPKLLQDTY